MSSVMLVEQQTALELTSQSDEMRLTLVVWYRNCGVVVAQSTGG